MINNNYLNNDDYLNNFDYINNCIKMVKQDGLLLENIENPSKTTIEEALRKDGNSLQFLEKQNEQYCLLAVKQKNLKIYDDNFKEISFEDLTSHMKKILEKVNQYFSQ